MKNWNSTSNTINGETFLGMRNKTWKHIRYKIFDQILNQALPQIENQVENQIRVRLQK